MSQSALETQVLLSVDLSEYTCIHNSGKPIYHPRYFKRMKNTS